jgi:hypothetical protein
MSITILEAVYWMGEVPATCQLTGMTITNQFVDGVVKGGTSWASMTPDAHKHFGCGFGKGLGQRYEKQTSGRWLKVEG